jgi:hypothetical protein
MAFLAKKQGKAESPLRRVVIGSLIGGLGMWTVLGAMFYFRPRFDPDTWLFGSAMCCILLIAVIKFSRGKKSIKISESKREDPAE